MASPSSQQWSHGLHRAASSGDSETLRSLLEQNHPPDTVGGIACWLRGASEFHTRTPLHYAAKGGHPECIRLLLVYGANPNSRDDDGYTPIHYVAQTYDPLASGNDKAVKVCQCLRHLVEFGCNFRATTNSKHTPLDLASRHKNSVCRDELLKHGT